MPVTECQASVVIAACSSSEINMRQGTMKEQRERERERAIEEENGRERETAKKRKNEEKKPEELLLLLHVLSCSRFLLCLEHCACTNDEISAESIISTRCLDRTAKKIRPIYHSNRCFRERKKRH